MKFEDQIITAAKVQRLEGRGYNDDILPEETDRRSMGVRNFFTLWMGSIHNVPNYNAVAGFLFPLAGGIVLGLSPLNVMLAIALAGAIVTAFMVLNGVAGSKYGIPFAIHLRSTYGNLGAKLPGFLRGCVAAIGWFAVQTYLGSKALYIILVKLFPAFAEIAPGVDILGISVPGLIAFMAFWAANVAIGFGGGGVLNKFTAILSPLIYVLVIGMTIWAVGAAGGIGSILSYQVASEGAVNPVFAYFVVFSSVLAVWAAPGASVSDFTRAAKSTGEQAKGQTLGLVVGYVVFAICSVIITVGGSIHSGVPYLDILELIGDWTSTPAVVFAMLCFLLSTISTNATGNIIPAAYQLSALLPSKIDYRKGILIASIASVVILPWKLMDGGIASFLNTIGAVLGPVAGCMMANFYLVRKQKLDLNLLYMDPAADNAGNPYFGVKKSAYAATIVALVLCLLGNFVPALSAISNISWFVGFFSAAILYVLFQRVDDKD
ncbi:allantoin permease [Tractidigestivibacter sp.]|uniref:allantoin permease n=1 Tax=Tractidigestivibacter sp. TaxID=2847320 RepID=UPI002A916FB0|nr:cytosine permease [Tractidigestivibacter sp.]MCI6274601.1 cytosine permease [Coriobacteriaceae bacterium]MDY5272000.1 cytosine permease [Tractidigestivibacter sp.]